MFYLNKWWLVSKEWSVDLLTHWGGSFSQILDSNFFRRIGRSRGGGGQEEMEEASQEESHYILAICVISWLYVDGKGEEKWYTSWDWRWHNKILSLSLFTPVCLSPISSAAPPQSPLQPPVQPIPLCTFKRTWLFCDNKNRGHQWKLPQLLGSYLLMHLL